MKRKLYEINTIDSWWAIRSFPGSGIKLNNTLRATGVVFKSIKPKFDK